MLHVATDKASTPPAFTRSPSFHPFFLPIYWIHARQSAAMVRRLYSNLSQLQPCPAVVGAGLAHICAGVGQLIGGAELMCRRGMAIAKKTSPRDCRGEHFPIFCVHWRRGAFITLNYDASF